MGLDEEGEDDEVGEVDEVEDFDDDVKDVNLFDGVKLKKENLIERSNWKDGEIDIYGRKKVDGVKYIFFYLRGKFNDLFEEIICI